IRPTAARRTAPCSCRAATWRWCARGTTSRPARWCGSISPATRRRSPGRSRSASTRTTSSSCRGRGERGDRARGGGRRLPARRRLRRRDLRRRARRGAVFLAVPVAERAQPAGLRRLPRDRAGRRPDQRPARLPAPRRRRAPALLGRRPRHPAGRDRRLPGLLHEGGAARSGGGGVHALYEFLLSLTPDDAPGEAYPFTVVENVADVPRGDAARGAEVYERACRGCHGEAFTGGDGSILRTPVPLPGVTETYPAEFPGVDPSLVVIEKVRHGRFFGIGGEMPLFSAEAMSDEDLGALLSYLEL